MKLNSDLFNAGKERKLRGMDDNKTLLTRLTKSGGCGSKIGPEDLRKALGGLKPFDDPNLLYGMGVGDDAGVYKISDNLAIVQTVDFFPPLVDDPYKFGRIAAVNALSDVYVMGARPITALSLLAVSCSVGIDAIGEILRGGADAVREAGAVVIGGHSIEDDEPKYGLAVTGVVDPQKMITNAGAMPGDALILTKKIGVGILLNMAKRDSTVITGEQLDRGVFDEAERAMMRSNRDASVAMVELGAHACTDVTGFGLLGHARNVAEASNVRLAIEYSRTPKYDGVESNAVSSGTKGGRRNYDWIESVLETTVGVTREMLMLLCDAQTSGGLLISIPEEKADALVKRLRDGGDEVSAIIGWVDDGPRGTIAVRP